jgi:predicted phosphodiesterase
MILITGDTHGSFERLFCETLFSQTPNPERDFLIICGDFGGLWCDAPEERRALNRLASLPYTVLFVDGNHENYDLLEQYPACSWNGGVVRRIRKNVLYLTRGQLFTLNGQTFFTMGGAQCHDIEGGLLDPEEPDFAQKLLQLRLERCRFRVRGYSWWERELPSEEELETGWQTLEANGFHADYIITHCAPNALQSIVSAYLCEPYPENRLTDFLQRVYDRCDFSRWFCGHYHTPLEFPRGFQVLSSGFVALPEHAPCDLLEECAGT